MADLKTAVFIVFVCIEDLASQKGHSLTRES